jgi:hypothetical protein
MKQSENNEQVCQLTTRTERHGGVYNIILALRHGQAVRSRTQHHLGRSTRLKDTDILARISRQQTELAIKYYQGSRTFQMKNVSVREHLRSMSKIL